MTPDERQGERLSELQTRFLDTPEMQDWDEAVQQLRQELEKGETVSLQITIPKAFLTMMSFIPSNEAMKPEEKRASVVITQALQREFDTFAGTPLEYARYRAVYNRLCDEMDMPEEKKPKPGASGSEQGREDTF